MIPISWAVRKRSNVVVVAAPMPTVKRLPPPQISNSSQPTNSKMEIDSTYFGRILTSLNYWTSISSGQYF
jgi:hypothetical protein